MTHSTYPAARPGVGDVLTRTFQLLRQRPGLFFGLGAATATASLIAVAAMAALMWLGWGTFIMAAVRADIGRVVELLAIWLGIVLALSLLGGVVSLLVSGLLVRLARDTHDGRRPSLADLLGILGGFAGRILPLAALGVVVTSAVVGIALLPMLASLGTLAADPSSPETAVGGILLSVALALPLSVLSGFLGVRLVYLVPVVCLEGLGWVAALRRAWSMTAGVFWRTFGVLALAYLLVYAATMVVSMGSQVFTVGILESIETANPMAPEFLGLLMAAMGIPIALQLVLQVATVPFQQTVITVMYVNRVSELTAPAGPAYPPAPPPYYGYPPPYYGYPPPPG